MRTNERKGSIVVLVAVLMVVLLGFGAFAIDISQMQAYKSELRRTADAAVLAATLQLLHETQHDSARLEADRSLADNAVFGDVATITTFEYGRWSDTTGFVPLCSSGCSAIANAVRLELAGPEQRFYLARLFGRSNFTLSTTVAAWLPVTATPCAAPFAIQLANWPLGLPSEGRPSATVLRNFPMRFTVKRLARPSDAPDSTYGAINLPPYPSSLGNGVDNYALNLSLTLPFAPTCHRLLPLMQVQAKIGGYNQETIDGTSAGGGLVRFCANLTGDACYGSGGQIGRAVRVPIVQPVPAGAACLDDTNVIFDEDRLSTGGALCYEVVDVGTFVIIGATIDLSEAGEVYAQYAGRDTIGPARGYAQRPILVQ
ncbi:MAG TPA: pilus assembly protein TadG-related protein [Gemmatimonadaceae bacterium]|nr:pilus assembly protein TadG-related protein [Gemmatimonadaceae bacterium]